VYGYLEGEDKEREERVEREEREEREEIDRGEVEGYL
jgi:hypothetical protein